MKQVALIVCKLDETEQDKNKAQALRRLPSVFGLLQLDFTIIDDEIQSRIFKSLFVCQQVLLRVRVGMSR